MALKRKRIIVPILLLLIPICVYAFDIPVLPYCPVCYNSCFGGALEYKKELLNPLAIEKIDIYLDEQKVNHINYNNKYVLIPIRYYIDKEWLWMSGKYSFGRYLHCDCGENR